MVQYAESYTAIAGKRETETMKTGKVAALLGIDPGTIKGWIARFPEYFTPAAQGKVSPQRDLEHTDLLVLNTIRVLRTDGEQDWDKIRDVLNTGQREQTLPFTGATVDVGETVIAQVERALTTTANLENALIRVDDLENEIEKLRRQLDESNAERRDLERKLNDLEKAKAVADALAAQELEFWRSGKLRYDPPNGG